MTKLTLKERQKKIREDSKAKEAEGVAALKNAQGTISKQLSSVVNAFNNEMKKLVTINKKISCENKTKKER